MKEISQWHADTLGEKAVAALVKNNFKAVYVRTKEEAAEKIQHLIPADATVGVGGSWTLQELGLPDLLEERGNTVFNHNKPGLTPEESMSLRRKELTSDVFLTSTNALTLDGQLVNVDGSGNRVAAMLFGPKQAIVVAGINKIVKDVAEGQNRVKLYAAPLNNKRLSRPNPCITTGECMDCQGPSRICNVTSIIHKKPLSIDMLVIIVGEPLGF